MALRIEPPLPNRPRPVLSPRGLALAVVAIVAVLCGSFGGWPGAVELGLLILLLLPLGWLAAWVSARGLRCERRCPAHVVAGMDTALEVRVENQSRFFDSFAVEIEDSLLPFAHRGISFGWLRPGGILRQTLSTRFVKRGVIREAAFTLRSGFPFGLFTTRFRQTAPVALTVFPRPVVPKRLRHVLDSELFETEEGGSTARDWIGEFRGIRRFQAGDPLKAVHWPATARSGMVMVRERDRPVPERYALVFHSYCPPGALLWPETFENSMELLAGLLKFCGERGVPVDLTASFLEWKTIQAADTSDLIPAMELLARARHEPQSGIGELVKTLRDLPGRHSVFVLSNTPVRLWEDLLPGLPRRVTCLDNADIRIRRPVFRW